MKLFRRNCQRCLGLNCVMCGRQTCCPKDSVFARCDGCQAIKDDHDAGLLDDVEFARLVDAQIGR